MTHYNAYAKESSGKKYMSSYAKQIAAEDNGGVGQKNFHSRFVDRNENTMSFFNEIMKLFGVERGLKKQLTEELNKCECEYSTGNNSKRFFNDEDLYRCLTMSPNAKAFCDKQKLNSWPEIISYRLWRYD